MNIDPNRTPVGVDLEEIREITARGSAIERAFSVETDSGRFDVIALPTVHFSDEFGDSRYFARAVPRYARGRFLEIGAGTGVVTIAVALEDHKCLSCRRERFVAVDINNEAVRNVLVNVTSNGLRDSIDVRQGDVFSCIQEDERFDTIFWNHPFHCGREDEDIVQRACFDPGYRGLEQFIRSGHRYLRDGGVILLGSGNFADLGEMNSLAARHDCQLILREYAHWPFRVKAGEMKTFNLYEIVKCSSSLRRRFA